MSLSMNSKAHTKVVESVYNVDIKDYGQPAWINPYVSSQGSAWVICKWAAKVQVSLYGSILCEKQTKASWTNP